MTPLPAKQPLFLTLLSALAARLGTSFGRFLATFDRSDGHFYGGIALLFAGIWQLHSLGLALTVCGALFCAVGLFGAFLSAQPAPLPTVQPANRSTGERR